MPTQRIALALGGLIILGAIVYVVYVLSAGGGQKVQFFAPTVRQDPPQAWSAETNYVDSVYEPIAAVGDLMRYELLRPGHTVDEKQFDAMLRLARLAQANARTNVPAGWSTIAVGFQDRTDDIVGMWPSLKWLRAHCSRTYDPNAPQAGGGVNGLHCTQTPPTVYMHEGASLDPIDAADAYPEIIWGFSTSYAAAWMQASMRDPQISDPKHVNDVMTIADGELNGVVDWSDYRKRMASAGMSNGN